MMTRRRLAGSAVGGAVALAGLCAAGLGTLTTSHLENAAASIAEGVSTRPEPAVATTAASVLAAAADANVPASVVADTSAAAAPAAEPAASEPVPPSPAAAAPAIEPVATEPVPPPPIAAAPAVEPVSTDPVPPAPTRGMQLASLPPSNAADDELKPSERPPGAAEQCTTDACVDAYLFALYERASKVDTEKVPEQHKVTIKKKGKVRTVTRTVIKYVVSDFTWKDPAAAQHAGMSLKDYVIGGMDHDFRLTLYRALRKLDDAGFMPGITSAFRDDYRQSIATGNKASSDRSYHGGSLRGGYGHGLAADIVSVKGDTRLERFAASEQMWAWIDAHEKELGIGRPYLDRDPPHVGPLEGTEYRVKRSLAHLQRRAAKTKKAAKPRSTTKQLSGAHDPARAGTQSRQSPG
jgi:hypothetical protein